MAQPKFSGVIFITALFAFLTSFCAVAYQQLFALTLSDVTGDFVLSQSLALGAFLLGMGGGAWRGEKCEASWRAFLRLELSLSISGLLAVAFVYFLDSIRHIYFPWRDARWLLALALPYVIWVGYLTGFELPVLMRWRSVNRAGLALAWSYFGALSATACVPLVFLPLFDVPAGAHLTALLNFAVACAIALAYSRSWRHYALLFASGAAFFVWLKAAPGLHHRYLEIVYSPNGAEEVSVSRLRSRYQWIDQVRANRAGAQDYTLYLDRKIQLSSATSRRYHESMALGALALLGRPPGRVLIVGGGDGLLARELLSSGAARIDLVELDERVLDLARHDNVLRALNGGALSDPRVRVHAGDGFAFLRNTKENYDLVLADLPFPHTYELSLLFSKEFYALAKARLNENGVMVMDFPAPAARDIHLATLLKTLTAAGFTRRLVYGMFDTFVAAGSGGSALHFDYPLLFEKLSDQTLFNMLTRPAEQQSAEKLPSARVNSVFFPRVFEPARGSLAGLHFSVSAAGHPGFLHAFLDRMRIHHERLYPAARLPSPLEDYWHRDFRRDLDFSFELANGMAWPRFQWVHHLAPGSSGAAGIEWFDFQTPEKLRAQWEQAFGFADPGDWTGVTWFPQRSVTEFHIPIVNEAGKITGFLSKIYLGRNFMRDEEIRIGPSDNHVTGYSQSGQVIWVRTLGSYGTATNATPQAAQVVDGVAREFLLPPGWYREGITEPSERVYFP